LKRLDHADCLVKAGFAGLNDCHLEWLLECIEIEGHVIVLEGRYFRSDAILGF